MLLCYHACLHAGHGSRTGGGSRGEDEGSGILGEAALGRLGVLSVQFTVVV